MIHLHVEYQNIPKPHFSVFEIFYLKKNQNFLYFSPDFYLYFNSSILLQINV